MITQIALFIANIILVNAAIISSFFIRYGLDIPESNFQPYKNNFAFLTFIYMSTLFIARTYKKRLKSYWDLFRRVLVGMFLGTLLGFMLLYIFRVRWASFPSSIFAICFCVGTILIFGFNGLILKLSGKIKKKIVVIGKEKGGLFFENGPLVETKRIDTIEELLRYEDADEVVICEKIHGDAQLNLLVYLLLKSRINVVFSPSMYTELLSDNVAEKNSIEYLATSLGRKSDWEEFLIRALDVVGSFLLLIPTAPLLAIVAAMVKFTSHGPVLYKQQRTGKDGKTFTLYKFRTMVQYAEEKTGPILAAENDMRVTKVGQFLRRTRIDELPQVWNVLQGDMSLVGPRPERQHFLKLHEVLRGIRLAVKPGLTGLAQVRSHYALKPHHKIRYDYLYIQRRSFLFNLYLLVKTIPVVFSLKGR